MGFAFRSKRSIANIIFYTSFLNVFSIFSLLINPGNAWLIVLHLKLFRPQHMRLIFWSRHFPSRLRREGFMKRCCPFPTFPRRRMSLFDVGQLSEQTQRKDTVFCAISLALTGNYRHRGRNAKKSRRFACSWESELRAIVFFPHWNGSVTMVSLAFRVLHRRYANEEFRVYPGRIRQGSAVCSSECEMPRNGTVLWFICLCCLSYYISLPSIYRNFVSEFTTFTIQVITWTFEY